MAGRELYAAAPGRQRRTWSVAAVILALAFVIVGQIGAVVPMQITRALPSDQTQWPTLSYILFVAFGLGAALTLAWVVFFERRRLANVGLNGDFAVRFGRGFGLGLAYLATVVCIIWATGAYRVEASGIFQAGLSAAVLTPLVVLLFGFIVQGSTEEIVFRGWLMGIIASRHGLVIALTVSSLLFGLAHAGNIDPSPELALALVNIALFGLFIGLYAAREGSIWGVCGWHAAWNWLLGTGFGLEVSGEVVNVTPSIVDLQAVDGAAWWLTGGAFGPEGSVVVTAVLLISAVVLVLRGGFARQGGLAPA
ncbi:CPBP family intramembrane glutamic endopeptidase [Brevundimonas subvibrioides]|uniref:Abortive infection protein n=1 Tax=Brevundimonas subvibrioides (strain ATCC 15264 / DSM 4735 / LMG 14903 / NBRC 16000 / CB 81) TaxID=633149 RepID=D9QLM3_BRESC|nr:CPBP family intramembrane glutamic endopeptidase [Brevundimonas subvibrioides]ADL01917.1 Abortive infection protein [Brevundimonas subvibrioides ATCC 15264]